MLRDRNHPSIVMWSLGNEITDRTGGVRGAEMAALLRSLAPTRPSTLGGGSTFTPDDPSWRYVDVGDVHYNANGKGYGQMHAANPDKAMTHNETFPATIYQDIKYARENVWATGTWVWAAWDYLGEAGIGKSMIPPVDTMEQIGDQSVMPGWSISRTLHHNWGGFGYPYPYFQANCGDFDLIGQRKPQSYWRDAVTGRSPVSVLVERPTPPGTEQGAIWWGYFDERPGELTAVAHRDGRELGRTALRTVGPATALRVTSDVRALTTSRDDLAHVLVEVVDHRGRVVSDATVEVAFDVRGAGALAAVGNGNPHNVDSFRLPRRHTWHGKALAILRPAKRPGVLTLRATTPGLRAVTPNLHVKK